MISSLASALLQTAIKNGMNIPSATKDFTRLTISLSASEERTRYEVYLYCLLAYQRSDTDPRLHLLVLTKLLDLPRVRVTV
jgi:hypothetical protein